MTVFFFTKSRTHTCPWPLANGLLLHAECLGDVGPQLIEVVRDVYATTKDAAEAGEGARRREGSQTSDRRGVAGDHDLLAGFRASHQLGELRPALVQPTCAMAEPSIVGRGRRRPPGTAILASTGV
jgi:hypothetical protein